MVTRQRLRLDRSGRSERSMHDGVSQRRWGEEAVGSERQKKWLRLGPCHHRMFRLRKLTFQVNQGANNIDTSVLLIPKRLQRLASYPNAHPRNVSSSASYDTPVVNYSIKKRQVSAKYGPQKHSKRIRIEWGHMWGTYITNGKREFTQGTGNNQTRYSSARGVLALGRPQRLDLVNCIPCQNHYLKHRRRRLVLRESLIGKRDRPVAVSAYD